MAVLGTFRAALTATQALREQGDAELVALAPLWEAAIDLYQQRMIEENAVEEAASDDGWPGPAPGPIHQWRAWFEQKEDWRERTGVAAAEDAAAEAGTALHEIEVQISELPAASLAGLKLKARVAQRSDDIEVTWPDGLGEGLVRDILAFTEAQAAAPKPAISIADRINFASVTMTELRVIHEKMQSLSDVAYAMASQGCCAAARSGLMVEYNAAGDLLHWLGDALTEVESRAAVEMTRRRPTSLDDQETRLAAIAGRVICNGDNDETAALIQDLTAFAIQQAGV